MGDLEIVEKLKGGDDEVFRIIVAKYQTLVLNCAFKFLRNRESAQDVTQEVFLEVFESIHSFRGDSQLSTWIYRIAVTKSLNYIKSQKRKKRFAHLVNLFEVNDSGERIAAPDESSPDKGVENQDRARVLQWALAKLPSSQRIAFALSKQNEMTYEEISQVMDISVPAVESLLHRARTGLKKTLYRFYKEHS